MAKRSVTNDNYISMDSIPDREEPVDSIALAMKIPIIVDYFDKSIIKQAQLKPDWSLYKVEERRGNPFIVREMCDRCGKVFVYPKWRKIRAYNDPDLGTIYFETGLCKDCINASVYVDCYLDGDVLTETESKDLFYKYAEDYERTWRMVIAAAPTTVMTNAEWDKACRFFNGCAVCGGPIEMRTMYFPRSLNGSHTAWNVVPMCQACYKRHYMGRTDTTKKIRLYRVFSSREFFNKSKTIRLYLLQQMIQHDVYMEPLKPFMERFRETKVLKGSEEDGKDC